MGLKFMEDLQRALIKIRMHKLLTWNQLAKEIGTTRTTLMNFMDYGVKPRFLTLARITQYIEKNEGIVKQKDIK